MGWPQSARVDLQALPRVQDGWTFLYVEMVRVDREDKAIVLHDAAGRIAVPAAMISVLLCGPGTTVTHAAVLTLADNGCSVVWVGENGVRFYAAGVGETRKSGNLLRQVDAYADPDRRLEVVHRMYRLRFRERLPTGLTLQQLRGMEGVRVREAYAAASRSTGVPWEGRNYDRSSWQGADPVNRALSCANAVLYGVCHAAIVATGFSPALGFIHTGKALSFVYDVADLYKAELTVPAAFLAAAKGPDDLERRTRHLCRDAFFRGRLLARVIPDIQRALDLEPEEVDVLVHGTGEDEVTGLWDPAGVMEGGRNHASSQDPS